MTNQCGFLSREDIPRAVGFTKSGKIVLEMGGGHLMLQDLQSTKKRDE